jgi:predicted DNA-binding protein (UPF0251 family)
LAESDGTTQGSSRREALSEKLQVQPLNRRQRQLHGLDTEVRCWRLYVDHGWSTRRIAVEVGVSRGAVSKALRRAEKRAAEALHNAVVRHKIIAWERYERCYQLAMEGYAASVGERVRKKTKRREGVHQCSEAETITDHVPGDPRFLGEARGAVTDTCRLLGLNTPPAAVVSPELDRPFEQFTEEELQREAIQTIKAFGLDQKALLDELMK